ncbi:MAG: HRDC domain-containing protein [Chloroflexota bacterium]|nr:HRDC domain-containing protein [Chloroflexota bacterium]
MTHRPLPASAVNPSLPPPTVVTTPLQLELLMNILSGQPAVAVDTESNSLYAYQERVCLIQFSIPGADYIVDPLAGLDLSSLAHLFSDSQMQKVFHAAEYDVMCLKRDFDFGFANLFDTMWAARILGWPRVGLGDVLKETFSVHTNKRYQRHNWGKRPLEPEALAYACLDTHYLLPLRRLQSDALVQKGYWEEAQEAFEQIAASDPRSHTFNSKDFRHVKGAFDLTVREQAVLRELYIWRDREARRRDRPPFKVLNDRILIALAQACPRTPDELVGIDGLKPYHARRYGGHILRAIEQGIRARPPLPPPPPLRHSEAEVARFQALRAWRKRVAAERGVDVDVIISNAVLWVLAEQNPGTLEGLNRINGLGPWKRKMYGEAILNVLTSW